MERKEYILLILFVVMLSSSLGAGMNDELKKGIQLFEARNFPEAKDFFESFAKKNPTNPTAAVYLGRIFLIEGDYDEAIDWFKKAVELNINSSEYHLWLGRAYGYKAERASIFKQPSLAKKVQNEFEKAVELDPDNIEARFDLMQYYLEAPGFMGGSKEKAREQAEYTKKQDSLEGHMAFGLIYEFEKNYVQAEECFKKYLKSGLKENSPLLSSAHLWLGMIYEKQGKKELAKTEYEAALKLDPDHKEAKEALK